MSLVAVYPFGEGVLSFLLNHSLEVTEAGYTPLDKPSLFSLYPAKVTKKDETLGGFFVELENGEEAFLPFSYSLRAKVGEKLTVQVVRESLEGKPPRVSEKYLLPLRGCEVSFNQRGRVFFLSQTEEEGREKLLKVAKEKGYLLKVKDAKECLRDLKLFETYLSLAKSEKPFRWFHFYTQTLLAGEGVKLFTESVEVLKNYREFLKIFGLNSAEATLLTLEKLVKKFPPSLWKGFFSQKVTFEGGYLLIYENEGLVFIDVNGNLNHYTLNLKALELITKLLPLRKWGGLIAVDFVDIPNRALKEKLKEEIKKRLNLLGCKGLGFTNGGLYEILCPKRVSPILQILEVYSPFCGCKVKSNGLLFLEIVWKISEFTSQSIWVILHPYRKGIETLFSKLSKGWVKVKFDPAVGVNEFKLLVGNG
ncbi:MAG: hypothetical protein DSZ31_03145 [Gammaproteobacteria bacterium]|nr:MAG: hypothetical protein DSZ31_03145 [Gammaproteobacteria bacterium]